MHYSLAERRGAALRCDPRPGVKSTKIAKRHIYIYAYCYAESAYCTRRDDTRPEFTSLMYVLGGDRSLSHELLIVRRHNSPRVSHPLSVPLSLPRGPRRHPHPSQLTHLCSVQAR